MKKIPLCKLGLDEVVYLIGFAIVVAVATCLLVLAAMLFLIAMKFIAKTFFAGKVAHIVLHSFVVVSGILLLYQKFVLKKHPNPKDEPEQTD